MSGSGDYFKHTATQIDLIAIVEPMRDLKWHGGIGFGIKTSRQFAANLARRELRLRIFLRASGIGARELGIHAVDIVESPVVADVIVVCMRIDHADRQFRQMLHKIFDIADAHAGVEQQALLRSEQQIRDDFFGLMRLIDGKHTWTNAIDFEPRVRLINFFQLAVLRARKFPAPLRLGGLGGGLSETEQYRKNEEGQVLARHGECKFSSWHSTRSASWAEEKRCRGDDECSPVCHESTRPAKQSGR